jgi:acylphosphatase
MTSSVSTPPTPGARRLRAVVSGRVQGVGFRASAEHEARRLGLGGWVRNLPEGGVELEAEGADAALERLLAFLRQGPRMARVDSVDVQWLPAAGLPHPFQVRSTF